MKENKKHLPVIGVGPVIVVPQIVLSAAGIFISTKEFLSFARISAFRIPFTVLGVVLIILGLYLRGKVAESSLRKRIRRILQKRQPLHSWFS